MDLSQFTGSPLPELIYEYHEKKQSDWRRAHLGCSQLGKACDRALWYGFRWALPPSFPGRMLRLFETGQLFEDRICEELKGIRVQVYDRQRFINLAPHISGSIDGCGEGFPESKKPHLVEFKTHNEKSFNDLKNKGVEKAKPEHYVQMNLYMGGLHLERAYYIAVNKNTDEIYAERVYYNPECYKNFLARGITTVQSAVPTKKISDNPSWYECKWCQYYAICHQASVPSVNCRTCLHSTPEQTGKWTCARDGGIIDTQTQREACEYHLFIPQLLNQEPTDAGEDFVMYHGWTNGYGFIRSVDYRV